MAAGPDISNLSHAQKDALIASLMAQVAALTARLAELEAKLGLPPKTPDNSSVPPSKGQKKSDPSTPSASPCEANLSLDTLDPAREGVSNYRSSVSGQPYCGYARHYQRHDVPCDGRNRFVYGPIYELDPPWRNARAVP